MKDVRKENKVKRTKVCDKARVEGEGLNVLARVRVSRVVGI